MKPSLTRRLLLVSTLVLLAFVGGTGIVLERAFIESLERGQRDRLQGVVYTVLAAARLDRQGLSVPADLPEARLMTPGSGLYVRVVGADATAWSSPSLLGVEFAAGARLAPGERRFQRGLIGGEPVYVLSYGLAWEQAELQRRYTVHVAEDLTAYFAQLAEFRRTLWGGLGLLGLLLLAAQLSVLRWSLAPLRRVVADLEEVRAGRAPRLSGRYPTEITPLADSLNALVDNERARAQRYRDTLGNLAHSLKTPLAVLRGSSSLAADPEAHEQLSRIDATVDYQLRRAAASSRDPLAPPLSIEPALGRLLASLHKVYRDKAVAVDCAVPGSAVFHGSEGDLLELLGNLLDNAFKWAAGRVRVRARQDNGLWLSVEDDGPGVDPALTEVVKQRGRRADERVPGQGLGLAVVQEIVAARRGELDIGRSTELGGARIEVRLPTS